MRSLLLLFPLCVAGFLAAPQPCSAEVRTWSSPHGQYTLQAEEIAFNDKLVVLKKSDGSLVAVLLSELSEADREYIAAKDKGNTDNPAEMQTWTTDEGLKIRGRVEAYGRREVTVQRRLGKLYVADQLFSTISPLQQKVILRVISKLEGVQLNDEKELLNWASALTARGKTYNLEGVKMQLESGDEISIPFFMFTPEEVAILKPGWDAWVAQHKDQEAAEQESFLMASQAHAYQQDRAQHQQIQMLKLNLLAANAGIIDIWEVELRPRGYGRTIRVAVPASDSRAASYIALRQHPGYVVGPIRKMNS